VDSLPSTNILALVLQKYTKKKRKMKFIGKNPEWELYRNQRGLFRATFQPRDIPSTSTLDMNTGKEGDLPFVTRPSSRADALDCIPPQLHEMFSPTIHETAAESLYFSSIKIAIRFECAFWLERQFKCDGRHWFHTTINAMLEMIENETRKAAERFDSNGKTVFMEKKTSLF